MKYDSASKTKKMQALTLYIEFFAFQRLHLKFYNFLCWTALCAQRPIPDLNLICTNILCKVLQKHSFVSNHNTSKNFQQKYSFFNLKGNYKTIKN